MFKFRPLAPPVSESTLRSISDPVSSLDAWVSLCGRMRDSLRPLFLRYVPTIQKIPQGMSFVPTWKSVPSMAWYSRLVSRCGDENGN